MTAQTSPDAISFWSSTKIATRLLIWGMALFGGIFFIYHAVTVSRSLSDNAYTDPNAPITPWRSEGLALTPIVDEPDGIQAGDIAIAVNNRPVADWLSARLCWRRTCPQPPPLLLTSSETLTYTVLRAGIIQDIPITLRPYPFADLFSRTWVSLVFPLVTYALFLFLLFRHPEENALVATALMASGFIGSSGWSWGLSVVHILEGAELWLHFFAVHVCYYVGLAGLVHFTLVFPRPLPKIRQNPRLLILPYIGVFALMAALGTIAGFKAENSLLWVQGLNESSTIVDILFDGSAILFLILNYRQQKEPEARQQVRLVAFAFVLVILFAIVLLALPQLLFGQRLVSTDAFNIFALLIPLAIVIAIRRNHLWSLDPIISRTLVYLTLSGVIIGLYSATVVLVGTLLQAENSLPVSIFSTGVVAVLFHPLRQGLQRVVNRLLYGQRDEPVEVLAQLTQQLERATGTAAVLPNLVATIASTLRVPHVSIWLPEPERGKDFVAASWGQPTEAAEHLPLTYQNEIIGRLAVAPRGPGERFQQDEMILLKSIAALTANSVQAVQLSDELRASRQRIVTAREEERRRLRRDLHDGLGPQLASQTLGLEAVSQLIPTQPERAQQLLDSLKEQAELATADVRRLVYNLRPPTLDDLGLLGALKQFIEHLEQGELNIEITTSGTLAQLPAAVETALYRITQEAVTNVVRHAGAKACVISLVQTEQRLTLTITDDGIGLPNPHPSGVGLLSMRERIAELNGHFTICTLPQGGTELKAVLPLEVFNEPE